MVFWRDQLILVFLVVVIIFDLRVVRISMVGKLADLNS